MRLIDLLEEGLKRSMDKLKEKERDKVIQRLTCVLCSMYFVVVFIFVFIERTGKVYKQSVNFWQAYISGLLHGLFHELLSVYCENIVHSYYKRPWPFLPLLTWHRISAASWQFTCHCFEPMTGEYWRLRRFEWIAYMRVHICWAPFPGSIWRVVISSKHQPREASLEPTE